MNKINKPKVTISFPVFNSALYVEKALNSVLDQDYLNLEILIIDDCGTDGSMQIVDDLLKSYHGDYRIISFGENKRQGFGRNYSIQEASGEFIFFMDSDDRLSLNAISKLVNAIESYKSELAIGSYVKESGKTVLPGVVYEDLFNVEGKYSLIRSNFINNIPVTAFMWNKLYRVSFLKAKGIKCVHPYVEDDLFSFKVMLKTQNCCFIPDVTYFYNVENLNSTTKTSMQSNNMSVQTARIHSEIVKTKYSYIDKLPNSPMKIKVLLEVLGTGIYHLSHIKKSSNISIKDKEEFMIMIIDKIPKISFSLYKDFTLKDHLKLFYYSFFIKISLRLKKMVLSLFNNVWYQFTIK